MTSLGALIASIVIIGDVLETIRSTGAQSLVLLTIWALGITAGVLSLTIINHLRPGDLS